MRKPLIALAAAAALGSLALPGAAAPVNTLKYDDKTGDANAVNTQGQILEELPQDNPGPVQYASADIKSVVYARRGGNLEVTLSLSEAPSRATFYRVNAEASACSIFWFQYGMTTTGTAIQPTLRHNCDGQTDATGLSATVNIPITAVVKGTDIVWTIPLTKLPKQVKVGSVLSALKAETRVFWSVPGAPLAPTVPVIDEVTSDKSFKI